MEQIILTSAMIGLVIVLSAFVQSTVGFGYAIVALSIFSYFLDFREANAIVALSILLPLVAAVWSYRGELKLTTLMICLGGAAAGMPFGLYFFTFIDEVWLIRITGVLIFLLSAEGLWSSQKVTQDGDASWQWASVAGVASGFLAGAVGMGGPPVATYASRQSWSPRQIKVFLLAFSLLVASLRAGGLSVTGWIDGSILFYSAVATPFAFLGGYIGLRISHNIDAKLFRRMTMGALMLMSIGMVFHQRKHEPEVPPVTAAEGSPVSRRISKPACSITLKDTALLLPRKLLELSFRMSTERKLFHQIIRTSVRTDEYIAGVRSVPHVSTHFNSCCFRDFVAPQSDHPPRLGSLSRFLKTRA